MAVNIYSAPREYQKYTPTSVAEYAAPIMAEAEAKGAQMAAVGRADTEFSGFQSDEDRFKVGIDALNQQKQSMLDQIMKGEDVSGSDMMGLVKDYNAQYGVNGAVTKAKAEYGTYQKEMATYAKNTKDFDPNLVAYMAKQARDAYALDPEAGFNMSPVARTRDIQKQANEYSKTYLTNHTMTTEDYGAANLVEMFDDNGDKTGRYENTVTKVTYSGTEANLQAAQVAVGNSIMGDPANAQYISQYSEAAGIDPSEMLGNAVNSSINLNSVYKVDNSKSQFTMKGVQAEGGNTALADYNTGSNEFFYTATTGSAESAISRELEYSKIEDAGRNVMEHGVGEFSKSEITADLHNMLRSIKLGSVEDQAIAMKLAKRHGLELTPEILADPAALEKFRVSSNTALSKKAEGSNDIGREGEAIASGVEAKFYKSDIKAKQERDDYNSKWNVPDGIIHDMLEAQMGTIYDSQDARIAAQDAIYYAKKAGYTGDVDSLTKEIERKTKFKWSGGGHSRGMKYYDKQMDTNRKSFKGSPTSVFKIEPGLKSAQDEKIQETFMATMDIISRNPNSTIINSDGKTLFGKSLNEVDFTAVEFESYELPNNGEFVVLNMNMPGTGTDKGSKKREKISIDLRTQEGMVAASKLLDIMPDGDQKEMLRIRMESRGTAGDMPDSRPQVIAGSPTFKYSLDGKGVMKLDHVNPGTGTTSDISLAYHADAATQALFSNRPGSQEAVNQIIAQVASEYKGKSSNIIEVATEEAIKEFAKANKINQQDTFLLLISAEKSSPEAKVKAIQAFTGLEEYVNSNALLTSKMNKSYTGYTRVHQYAKNNHTWETTKKTQ